jgi:uncharacterized NAD(P)/FAD-binding protein YdhS
VCLAIHLLRFGPAGVSLAIVGNDARFGRGVAYGTRCHAHVLNVPAARMSVLADEPGHFLEWVSRRYGFAGGDFVPRAIYGEYLEAALDEELAARPEASLRWVHGNAIAVKPRADEATVLLGSGESVRAGRVVLAVGNAPPRSPACLESLSAARYRSNAWAQNLPGGWDAAQDVLLVGSGLTAVDQVLALSQAERKGTIFVLSRRGQLPVPHCAGPAWPARWTQELRGGLRSIVRQVRQQVAVAAAQGIGWRAVVDSLRHATPALWQALSADDKRQFLRHVRPYWETARHRIAPAVHAELQGLIESGRVVLLAGRIAGATEVDERIQVTYLERRSWTPRELVVDRVVNCTGPGMAARVHGDLLCDLLDRGLGRLDPLGLGLETAADGALIDAGGRASETIFAIGPMRKPSEWESTAVPEIRAQARELAALLSVGMSRSVPSEALVA